MGCIPIVLSVPYTYSPQQGKPVETDFCPRVCLTCCAIPREKKKIAVWCHSGHEWSWNSKMKKTGKGLHLLEFIFKK